MVMVWRVGEREGGRKGEGAKEKVADDEKGMDGLPDYSGCSYKLVSKAPNSSNGQGITMYIAWAWGHKLPMDMNRRAREAKNEIMCTLKIIPGTNCVVASFSQPQ